MIIEFSQAVAAPKDRVFAALLDPAILEQCIDGLESMTPVGKDAYELRAKGGLRGTVRLDSAQAGESLTLVVDGRAFAGSLKANVTLRLFPKDAGTEVRGTADVTVGGFLVALGPKIIESGARQAIAEFYSKFSARVTASGT